MTDARSTTPSTEDRWLAELVAEHDAAVAPRRAQWDQDAPALDCWLAELVEPEGEREPG